MFFDREGLVSVAQRIGGASRVLTRSVAVPLTAAATAADDYNTATRTAGAKWGRKRLKVGEIVSLILT